MELQIVIDDCGEFFVNGIEVPTNYGYDTWKNRGIEVDNCYNVSDEFKEGWERMDLFKTREAESFYRNKEMVPIKFCNYWLRQLFNEIPDTIFYIKIQKHVIQSTGTI